MSVIWKYDVAIGDGVARLTMPRGATVLRFGNQREHACIWALVNPDADVAERRFTLVGTGHTLPPDADKWIYVGTDQFMDGLLVLHLWEIP